MELVVKGISKGFTLFWKTTYHVVEAGRFIHSKVSKAFTFVIW